MNYLTNQKNIDSSPRKLRLLADMIRKMSPDQAIETLQFTQRSGAESLRKAIQTAMANSRGASRLAFKTIEINEGLKLRRYRVGTAGRGRGRAYRKRFSQIKIVLTDEVQIINDKLQITKKKGREQVKARPGDSVKEVAQKNQGRPESA
jgi:large subunit ribosomal protein L22